MARVGWEGGCDPVESQVDGVGVAWTQPLPGMKNPRQCLSDPDVELLLGFLQNLDNINKGSARRRLSLPNMTMQPGAPCAMGLSPPPPCPQSGWALAWPILSSTGGCSTPCSTGSCSRTRACTG